MCDISGPLSYLTTYLFPGGVQSSNKEIADSFIAIPMQAVISLIGNWSDLGCRWILEMTLRQKMESRQAFEFKKGLSQPKFNFVTSSRDILQLVSTPTG